MKKIILIFYILFFIQNIIHSQNITLNVDTEIELYNSRVISSKNLKKGDILHLYVRNDINDPNTGKTIITANTKVFANVINAERAKAGGKQGSFDIVVDNVKAIDGQSIPVFLDLNNQGKNNRNANVTVGLLLFWPALLAKGGDALIQVGSPFIVRTLQDIKFNSKNLQKRKVNEENIIYNNLINEQIVKCGKKPIPPRKKPGIGDFTYKSSNEYIIYKKKLKKWQDCMPYGISK